MIHTILYYGRVGMNFQRLHELGGDFEIEKRDSGDCAEVASPSSKVDGIVVVAELRVNSGFVAVEG